MSNFVLVPPTRSPVKPATGQLKPTGQRDYILLDQSTSMCVQWEEALEAVNTYVRTLRSNKVDTRIMLAAFNHEYQIVWHDFAPSVCAPLTSKDVDAGGGTALYDAIGKIVLRAKTDNPEKATIVIVSDGGDGESCELTAGHAAGLIAQCRARGWQIILIGMGFDNTDMAQQFGLAPTEFIATGKESMPALMGKVAEKRTAYGQTGQRIGFTDAEKAASRLLLR
jgi:von Willebrand factor type A domain